MVGFHVAHCCRVLPIVVKCWTLSVAHRCASHRRPLKVTPLTLTTTTAAAQVPHYSCAKLKMGRRARRYHYYFSFNGEPIRSNNLIVLFTYIFNWGWNMITWLWSWFLKEIITRKEPSKICGFKIQGLILSFIGTVSKFHGITDWWCCWIIALCRMKVHYFSPNLQMIHRSITSSYF